MKIVVCIKQVPDTTEVKLDPETGRLIRAGIPVIINPDDKSALEAALQLKETEEGSTITVISMGPPKAEDALREALAMGADEAILISDRVFGGADTWATSSTIAAAIKKLDYDVIIAGRQAIDGDTAQVGPQIAEHLGIPQISYCEDIKAQGDKFIVRRQFEDRYHILEVARPCLFTTLKEAIEPRYMSIGGIYDAYQKEIPTWGFEQLKDTLDESDIGLKGSPTRVKKSFTKQGKSQGVKHDNLDTNQAVAVILDKLQERFII